jgi:hypothetical protein
MRMKPLALSAAIAASAVTAFGFAAAKDQEKTSESPAMHQHETMGESAGKTQTLTGELLDLACYVGHEAKGEKHKSCAQACISGGAPMGLLTSDGHVYLLVENHELKKPYEELKTKAAEQVKVTGTVQERGGLPAIVVTAVAKPS